jgi:hypothetical protein
MKKIILFLSIIYSISSFSGYSQQSFDLVVVSTTGKGGSLKVLPQTSYLLTDRPEYDNQPNFINEYQLVFSAADQKGNHDIIVYNFNSKKFTNLTKTPDINEFSPGLTDCGLYVSAVVMEQDKKQRLWLYPINFGEPELLYDDIEPVGYYDWYDNKAAMFVLGTPNKLVYARGKNDLLEIDSNIARSVKKRPKTGQITYLSNQEKIKIEDKEALALKSFDLETSKSENLGYGLEGSQDFIWLDKNYLLMASGNSIYRRKKSVKTWELVSSIPIQTHQNISRMAYSADLNVLVLTMERKQSPQ